MLIKNLEEELGTQLIERGGRKKMRLTAAGKILLEGARETLRVAERTAETSNITAQIIANGFGVTLASLSSIENRIDGVSILQLRDSKPDLELGLIYTDVNRDLPLIQGFLGMLTK